jgi:hypothetical protein
MKTIDDSLEWHDENELVRRLDVVEAVLNLADTIDDVIDVIMSVPTYKVQTSTNIAMGSDSISTNADRKTENSSEKPNNCEHITEDGVTCAKYPACDDCPDNPLNKVKGSKRLLKGSEQTDCQTCKWWSSYGYCVRRECKGYAPQTERSSE